MTKSVSSSLVIDFSSNVAGHLSLEVDSRETGYNGGVTSFYKGSSPAFLVYRSANVRLLSMAVTQGLLQPLAGGTYSVDKWVTCAKETSVSLDLPVHSNFTVLTSYGDSLAGYVIDGDAMKFKSPVLASIHVSFTVAFDAYRITGNLGDAPIVVYATGDIP